MLQKDLFQKSFHYQYKENEGRIFQTDPIP